METPVIPDKILAWVAKLVSNGIVAQHIAGDEHTGVLHYYTIGHLIKVSGTYTGFLRTIDVCASNVAMSGTGHQNIVIPAHEFDPHKIHIFALVGVNLT